MVEILMLASAGNIQIERNKLTVLHVLMLC